MLEIGETIVWVEVEMKVMWCGHIACARWCQEMGSVIKSDRQRTIARDEGGHRCETEMMKDDSVGYSPIQGLLYSTVVAVHVCHCKWHGRVENVCRGTLMGWWRCGKDLLDRLNSGGGKCKVDEHGWCRSSDIAGDR